MKLIERLIDFKSVVEALQGDPTISAGDKQVLQWFAQHIESVVIEGIRDVQQLYGQPRPKPTLPILKGFFHEWNGRK